MKYKDSTITDTMPKRPVLNLYNG